MGNKVGAILSVVTVVVAVAVIGFIVLGGSSFIHFGETEYKVSYDLDGGTNDADNPSSYIGGKGAQLYSPYKEGYVFDGWYRDPALTEEVEYITTDESGDLKLYASWEQSFVGKVWNYTMSGYQSELITKKTISGTTAMSFLMYTYDSGYLSTTSAKYVIGTDHHTYEDTSFSTEEDDKDWYYTKTETITTGLGEKECIVYTAEDSSKRETWIAYYGVEDSILYREDNLIVNAIGKTTFDLTYTLSSITDITASEKYSLDVYMDVGVSVTGSGDHKATDTVTLNETVGDDIKFKGWYSESGVLLSKSRTFIVDKVYTDLKVYAMNTDEPDVVYNELEIEYSPTVTVSNDTEWKIVGEDDVLATGSTFKYTFETAGLYDIEFAGSTSDGARYCGTLSMVVGGQVMKTYEWKYLGEEYSVDLFIGYDDYQSYCNSSIKRSSSSSTHDREFVTYNDQYVKTLAQKLKDMDVMKTATQKEYADFVLCFVQNIEYKYDQDSKGTSEYWKYPVETLYEQNGDCEDTSILYCALMKSQGYDVALLLYTGSQYADNGHCAAGIVVESVAGGYYYTVDGKDYYYCETTATGYTIGKIPDGYGTATRVTVI